MQVNATVIAAFTEKAMSKGGKPYDKVSFTYKVDGGRGAESKTILPFKQREIAAQILALVPQQKVSLTLEKIGEYWEITEVIALSGDVDAVEEAVVAAKTVQAGGATAKSALPSDNKAYLAIQDDKQIMIVRQSSLGHAVATLTANKGEGGYTSDDVIITAQEYVEFVLNGPGVSAPAPAPVAITRKPANKRNHTHADDLVEDFSDIPA